jgi:hypothetical protein
VAVEFGGRPCGLFTGWTSDWDLVIATYLAILANVYQEYIQERALITLRWEIVVRWGKSDRERFG